MTIFKFSLFDLDHKDNRRVSKILLRIFGRSTRVLLQFLFLFHLSYQFKHKLLEIKRVSTRLRQPAIIIVLKSYLKNFFLSCQA